MSNSTTTISFRASWSIDEQIQQIAKANGQSKGDWVRDQVMKALHHLNPTGPMTLKPQVDVTEPPAALLEAVEACIRQSENAIRGEICRLRAAINEASKINNGESANLAPTGQNTQQSESRRSAAAGAESRPVTEPHKQPQQPPESDLIRAIRHARGKRW